MPPETAELHPHDSSVVGTLQSLVVAFVLAMTFRGFVTEGFVIPTGSMAPSLMGRHLLFDSRQTGAEVAVGVDRGDAKINPNSERFHRRLSDPMLGPGYPGTVIEPGRTWDQPLVPRMGDRILVLKSLYPFNEPDRYDVVVFKNPTDPLGDSANYIKRLIGLPGEDVWLVDGDVFSRRNGDGRFFVRRKPEHVQRAVWAPIFDSDFMPKTPEIIGVPPDTWPPLTGITFDEATRSYRIDSADRAAMSWNNTIRRLDDWIPYNMDPTGRRPPTEPVSVIDLRISAAINPDDVGLNTTLELEGRNTIYQFTLTPTEATVRQRAIGDPDNWRSASEPIALPDRVFNVEFWHADQRMAIYVDGELIIELEYDWTPEQRLRRATGDEVTDQVDALIDNTRRDLTKLRWSFEGAPATLSRVRIDRDLFYRHGRHQPGQQLHQPYLHGRGAAMEPLALGPDQFFMCGDNSPSSLDGRFWGRPHELIAERIDPTPSVVNRKLLMGKAWVVYFPSPYRLKENGVPIVPDFGRLRFIR